MKPQPLVLAQSYLYVWYFCFHKCFCLLLESVSEEWAGSPLGSATDQNSANKPGALANPIHNNICHAPHHQEWLFDEDSEYEEAEQ